MSATLFDGSRLQMTDSIRLTAESLNAHGGSYDDWAFAWSGGKDSTTCLTLCLYMIESGQVKRTKAMVSSGRRDKQGATMAPEVLLINKRGAGLFD